MIFIFSNCIHNLKLFNSSNHETLIDQLYKTQALNQKLLWIDNMFTQLNKISSRQWNLNTEIFFVLPEILFLRGQNIGMRKYHNLLLEKRGLSYWWTHPLSLSSTKYFTLQQKSIRTIYSVWSKMGSFQLSLVDTIHAAVLLPTRCVLTINKTF